jgi:hypothetical protein
MGKRDEMGSWLEKLGVEGLKSQPQEELEEASEPGPPATDIERADAGGQAGGRATMEIAPPIGTLKLAAISRADNEGRAFEVIIPASDKVTLLFKAAQAGKSVGTVTISTDNGTKIVLADVQISSIQMNGSTVQMRMESSKPAEISSTSDP